MVNKIKFILIIFCCGTSAAKADIDQKISNSFFHIKSAYIAAEMCQYYEDQVGIAHYSHRNGLNIKYAFATRVGFPTAITDSRTESRNHGVNRAITYSINKDKTKLCAEYIRLYKGENAAVAKLLFKKI